MAGAEARAAWQKTGSHCFVQEDTIRAPKLACPSAYPSSKQVDGVPTNTSDGLENPDLGYLPFNRNSSYSILPPESRWWLQIQPNYVYEKGFTDEQLNTVITEMEDYETKASNPSFKGSNKEDDALIGVQKEELGKQPYELLEIDSVGCSVAKEVDGLGFDPDCPWVGGGKSEPWWRVADRDEIASLVSQRSLDLIENCDLPWPLNRSGERDLCRFSRNYDRFGILPLSNGLKSQKEGLLSPEVRDGIFTFESACGKQSVLCQEQAPSDSGKQSSDDTIHKGLTKLLENNPTRSQLMEALRHSQTRAREAEKAAKQAYAEKEHILKLFFRQASHLFAHKQWFRFLQLENLCFRIRNSNKQLSSLPLILPWAPTKPRKPPKNWPKGKRSRRTRYNKDMCNYAAAFMLGLGLVGAGLFLGWTMAWVLPAF